MAAVQSDEQYPHSLTIHIPFPTQRLATFALRSLAVDEELSALVKRDFTLVAPASRSSLIRQDPFKASLLVNAAPNEPIHEQLVEPTSDLSIDSEGKTVLQVHYKATTPRMLRVAVNGFFESLGVIVQCMEELDVDVLHEKGLEGLEGVQGVEQGITGAAVGVNG